MEVRSSPEYFSISNAFKTVRKVTMEVGDPFHNTDRCNMETSLRPVSALKHGKSEFCLQNQNLSSQESCKSNLDISRKSDFNYP